MDMNNIREMEDFSLFEDFKEGNFFKKIGKKTNKFFKKDTPKFFKKDVPKFFSSKASSSRVIQKPTCNYSNYVLKNPTYQMEVSKNLILTNERVKLNKTVNDLSNNVYLLKKEKTDTINQQVRLVEDISKNITELKKQEDAFQNINSYFTITNHENRENFAVNEYNFGNDKNNQDIKNNNKNYLTSIQTQNKSLKDAISHLSGNYSSDNQNFLYEQQHITYWTAVNFWMFYIYMFLAVVYGIIYFIYGEGTLGGKIFWYLHVFFYPYLIIYTELASYLFLTYVYCWMVGQPFTLWKYFTSYPSIV